MNNIFIMTNSVSEFSDIVYISLNVFNISLTFWTILKNFLYKHALKFALCITLRKQSSPESQCKLGNNSVVSNLFILLC